MRSRAPAVEGFEVSGFVSRGILVDGGEAPQGVVVVLQLVVESSIFRIFPLRRRCASPADYLLYFNSLRVVQCSVHLGHKE